MVLSPSRAGHRPAGNMTVLRVAKVLSALPDPLVANTVYAVRVGTGFDLYIVDSTGLIAYKINVPADTGIISPNPQSGTSYTLVATDAGKEVDRTNATNNATVIDASVLPVGGMGLIRRAAAGALVVTPAAGTTILPAKASVTCGPQGNALSWRCKSATEVWVGGETA